mgnify:CR=1 FL=1
MREKYLTFFILFGFLSCTNKVEKVTTINNLKDSFIDSLTPNKKMIREGYITYNVEISGFSNDSIILNINNGKKESNIYLKGNFNQKFVDEYLGKFTRYININPYKSTKNKIFIKYGLYK